MLQDLVNEMEDEMTALGLTLLKKEKRSVKYEVHVEQTQLSKLMGIYPGAYFFAPNSVKGYVTLVFDNYREHAAFLQKLSYLNHCTQPLRSAEMKQPEDNKTDDLFAQSLDAMRDIVTNRGNAPEHRIEAARILLDRCSPQPPVVPLPGRIHEAIMAARLAMQELEESIAESLKDKQ